MKTLVIVLALVGVTHADSFPATGPCNDAEACEAACAKNKKGTCYWGGVLLVQSAVDETIQPRALKLFDRACATGDADACWQSAMILWNQDSKAQGDGTKPRAAFQKACAKNHARACLTLGQIAGAASDAKSQKLAATSNAKGVKLLEQKCVKSKVVRACTWVASMYEGDERVKSDPAKAAAFRDKACVIETGKACPPPEPPPPSHSKPVLKKGAPNTKAM